MKGASRGSYVGDGLEVVRLPFVFVAVGLFAVHYILHDDVMRWRKAYYGAQAVIRSMEKVRYPDEQRFGVAGHMLCVRIEQVIAEEGIL